MAVFGGEFLEREVDIAVGLFDFIDYDIVGVVTVFACPDFELFDVAEPVVFGGFAYGEHAVEEIVEFLGACEVVLDDWTGEGAFGRMGYYQERPAVAFLEVHQFHHKESGVDAFVAAVAEVGEVVDYRHFASECQHCVFDVLEDFFFVVLYIEGHRVDLGSVEGFRECVERVRGGVRVSHLELFVGELAVNKQNFLDDGDFFGHLDGVDGFADVGVGEEAADFAFVPEFVIQRSGSGRRFASDRVRFAVLTVNIPMLSADEALSISSHIALSGCISIRRASFAYLSSFP